MMTLQNKFLYVRNKWHPLWKLRSIPLYRYLQYKIDFVLFIKISKIRDKVAVKFFRDFSWVFNSNNLEPEIRDAFRLVLDLIKPKVFWDIGANIGFYSWFVRQSLSIKNIVMFEPDPINYSLLQKTITRNRMTNLQVFNVAVSDRVGEAAFVVDQASGATGSLEVVAYTNDKSSIQSHYAMGKTISCHTVSIDSIVHNMPLPDFIKIDVEGAEHLVISGAKSYINQYKPTIIVETFNIDSIRNLYNSGYIIFQIDKTNFLCVSDDLKDVSEKIEETLSVVEFK